MTTTDAFVQTLEAFLRDVHSEADTIKFEFSVQKARALLDDLQQPAGGRMRRDQDDYLFTDAYGTVWRLKVVAEHGYPFLVQLERKHPAELEP